MNDLTQALLHDVPQVVVNLRNSALVQDSTTSAAQPGLLTRKTVEGLRATFLERGHRPSPEMWVSLQALIQNLEDMAEGTCTPVIHLSSLDPGVGKTQAIVHFLHALLGSPLHHDVGVIICVSRLDEIRSFVEEANLEDHQFAVLTSDTNGLNRLGSRHPEEAPVLFTTQQMVERRCEACQFEAARPFHYRRKPRQVRVWDESILPGQVLTVGRDELAKLLDPIRPSHPDLAETIEGLFTIVRDVEDGERLELPDFATTFAVDHMEILRLLSGSSVDVQQVAARLWLLSGKTVTVRRDGTRAGTILDYRDTLPSDLAPLLVLDASGRVRETYRLWEQRRYGLRRLPSAQKGYANLNVHLWQVGGGKSAFRRRGQELIDAIATTINRKPQEEWLVVHHRSETLGFRFEDKVRDLVTGSKSRVHFLTWGNHHGTNAYVGVPNVILAGTLFFPPSYYEAMGRMAADQPSSAGRFGDDDRERVALGEHRHMILQALCRGAVRRCLGSVCAPCDAYIIASQRSGIPKTIGEIFPGCRVRPWQPIRRALKGRIGEALNYIELRLEADPNCVVSFREVQTAIGIGSSSNFRNDIRRHPDFEQALAERWIIEWGKGQRRTCFRRNSAELYGFTEEDGYELPPTASEAAHQAL